MMSSVENWTERDGQFDLQRFYNYIVQLLDPEAGPLSEQWVTETLAWWK